MPERIREPFDKGLSLVPEEKFLLSVDPAGFPADKDNCGPQGVSPRSKSEPHDWIRTAMKALHRVRIAHAPLFSTIAPPANPVPVILPRFPLAFIPEVPPPACTVQMYEC